MTPDVTIVVVPRERFNLSVTSLRSILDHTEVPYDLVYVDGRSPAPVARRLRALADEHRFRLVRSERYLSPNAARNLGLAHVTTPYVCFVDNDLIVTDGWLTRLLACAEETGAWMVGPLYLEGDPVDEIIHMAGGDITLEGEHGRRHFSTHHRLQGTAVADAPEPLVRTPVDFVEFHCVLLRTDAFAAPSVGMDEGLLSSREHLDLSMQVRRAGGGVWFEPGAVVTYSTPPPVVLSDVAYFLTRWSEAWNRASLEHFCDKYGIDRSYLEKAAVMNGRRRIVLDPVRKVVRRAGGERIDELAAKVLYRVERGLNARLVKVPEPSGAPVVADRSRATTSA